ncbi:ATP-binding protein [Paenibacillus antri]|uniref:ATP-binding protein n=1 Tax=Paenibacillus antri TaxID=2582848 RepID=A0A5R9GGH5_9BACL|nr:AAA family ATPase [Paenibacillus antri]TLS52414.1 ATP-binding protein [Paenibacillus antri]
MSKIILFRGMSGTGKTTLSNILGKRIHVPVLHKDDIYDAVAESVPGHEIRNKICFDFLFRFLQTVIDSSAVIILDFGLNHVDDVRNLRSWIEERGGTLLSFYCICSDESIWSERISDRCANPLPNQRITDLSDLKEHYKKVNTEKLEGEIVLDTIKEPESLIDQVESFLRGHHCVE